MQVRDGGAWKNITPHASDGGVWKPAQEVWVKYAGVWTKEWSRFLYETIITCVVNNGGPASTWSYKGFEGDSGSYTLTPGGSVSPTDVGGHPILTASIYVGYANGVPEDTNLYLRLTVPIGESGPWLSIRSITVGGMTIPGRFQREYDAKYNSPKPIVYFVVRATSNDLGTANYAPQAFTEEEKSALIALNASLSQGSTFSVQFN